jgi:nucleoid DNA-binding protein
MNGKGRVTLRDAAAPNILRGGADIARFLAGSDEPDEIIRQTGMTCTGLEPAASLFGASKDQLGKFDDYEGCANLVYQFGHTSLRELANEISRISTVSTVDTMAVLGALLTIIPQQLAAGNIVELGDFGSSWLQISSSDSAAPEAVRNGQVTNILPRFNAGKEFKKALAEIKFEKA